MYRPTIKKITTPHSYHLSIVLFFIFEVIEYRIETTYIPPVGVEVYSVKSVEVKDWTGIVFTIPVSIVVFYFMVQGFFTGKLTYKIYFGIYDICRKISSFFRRW